MIEILAAQTLIPDYDDSSRLGRPEDSFEGPIRKLLRTMSPPVILLARILQDMQPLLAPVISKDPYGIGIYCALHSGPLDTECAKRLKSTPESEWAAIFQNTCPPKQHLKSYISIGAAHLGILLQTRGPIMTFYHHTNAVSHAIRSAGLDLADGKVEVAVVASASCQPDSPKDGAAVLALQSEDPVKSWKSPDPSLPTEFGIATQLINFVKERNSHSI